MPEMAKPEPSFEEARPRPCLLLGILTESKIFFIHEIHEKHEIRQWLIYNQQITWKVVWSILIFVRIC